MPDKTNNESGDSISKAADKVWEMAEEAKHSGYLKLAAILKQVSTDLHFIATNERSNDD